jgi:hypothetical protein
MVTIDSDQVLQVFDPSYKLSLKYIFSIQASSVLNQRTHTNTNNAMTTSSTSTIDKIFLMKK